MTIDAKIFDLNYSNPKVVELVIRKKKAERYKKRGREVRS